MGFAFAHGMRRHMCSHACVAYYLSTRGKAAQKCMPMRCRRTREDVQPHLAAACMAHGALVVGAAGRQARPAQHAYVEGSPPGARWHQRHGAGYLPLCQRLRIHPAADLEPVVASRGGIGRVGGVPILTRQRGLQKAGESAMSQCHARPGAAGGASRCMQLHTLHRSGAMLSKLSHAATCPTPSAAHLVGERRCRPRPRSGHQKVENAAAVADLQPKQGTSA